jgi:hypothetical protein
MLFFGVLVLWPMATTDYLRRTGGVQPPAGDMPTAGGPTFTGNPQVHLICKGPYLWRAWNRSERALGKYM